MGNNIQMTVNIEFVWVIETIYQPFFLMKINLNKKSFGSWKITVDDFCWYVLADVKKNASKIAISVIPANTIFVSGKILFAFSQNFLTLFNILIFFVRSFAPAQTIWVSGWIFKVSSTSSRISSLVGPGKLPTDTFLDFESPQLLMLFNTESPIMMTFLLFFFFL